MAGAAGVLVWMLIEQDGAVLLSRHKATSKPLTGQWTLPGEGMPADESAQETLERFAIEQLDIRVTWDDFEDSLELRLRDVDYVANVFRVTAFEGRLRFRESGPYEEMRWFPIDELPQMAAPLQELLGKTKEGRLA
jgi:ADP-ribose pyrophosphatase YjhB (NUDIX family)